MIDGRERNKALAKERLEARRRKLKQKQEVENMEEKLQAVDEQEKLEDVILAGEGGRWWIGVHL